MGFRALGVEGIYSLEFRVAAHSQLVYVHVGGPTCPKGTTRRCLRHLLAFVSPFPVLAEVMLAVP